jgi:hypothetical protein
MTALSKKLKRLGLELADLVIRETVKRGEEKVVYYKLSPEAWSTLKQILETSQLN